VHTTFSTALVQLLDAVSVYESEPQRETAIVLVTEVLPRKSINKPPSPCYMLAQVKSREREKLFPPLLSMFFLDLAQTGVSHQKMTPTGTLVSPLKIRDNSGL